MKVGARKRGSKWSYYFDLGVVNGKRKKKEKGGFRTKAEALSAGREAVQEYEKTGVVFEPTKMTVAEYMDFWYENSVLINSDKHNTHRFYENKIRVHIKPALGTLRLLAITPAKLQKFINTKSQEDYAKGTLSGIRVTLSAAFGMAVHPFQFIRSNPMENVKLPKNIEEDKTDKTPPTTITIDEFNILIEHFPQGTNHYIPLQIGFHTGFRPGEICALRWPDVDLDNGYITINKTLVYNKSTKEWYLGTPKTKASYRKIKIGETLITILREHKEWQKENKMKYGQHYIIPELYYRDRKTTELIKGEFICTKENGASFHTTSLEYMTKVARRMGINFTPHTLRHTHLTMLLEAGENPKAVQKRSGHRTLDTLMEVYFHVRPKLEEQTVQTFENLLKK